MRARGIVPVGWWIVALTTVAIGILTAKVQAKWVGPALVGVGTACFAVFIAGRWCTHRLFDGEIRDRRSAYLIMLLVAVIYEAMITIFFVSYVLTVGRNPCWCQDALSRQTLVQLTVGGFLILWLEIIGVYGLAVSLYGSFHGRGR
jgi:hypothetical protein